MIRNLRIALVLCLFGWGSTARGDMIVGYNVAGPNPGDVTAVANANATAKTFGGAAFGLENLTPGSATSNLNLSATDTSLSNIVRFGFDAVGGVWTLEDVGFFLVSLGGTHEFDLRVTINGGTTSTIGSGFVSDDGVAEEFLGLPFTDVSSAEFELELTNNNGAEFGILGNGYEPNFGSVGINMAVAGTFTAVPEPGAASLVMLGGVFCFSRRRRR